MHIPTIVTENCIVDVIVVGSGAAGLSAALAAAHRGLEVLILEKSDRIGGTSAMSGAGTWIPANHHSARAGHGDSRENALAYLRATAPANWAETEDRLWQAFVSEAPDMLEFLEAKTPIRFEIVNEPDPMTEAEGGMAIGRMLSPKLLSRRIVGAWSGRLRRSSIPHSFTYKESEIYDFYKKPIRSALRFSSHLARRLLKQEVGQGSALIIGLLKGCLDTGCKVETSARVLELVQTKEGRVSGIIAETRRGIARVTARCGVILATGGFEWDAALLAKHFPGPVDRLGSPDTNTGDGQAMAMRAGAAMERMDQANIYPCLPTRYDGKSHGMPMMFQASPYAIIVNRRGHRFCSEYDFNLGEIMDERDPETGEPVHLPAWLVADHRFMKSSLPFRFYAAHERGWVKRAPTIVELARKISVPATALAETVARFNRFCEAGHDGDFRRGGSRWEIYSAGADEKTDVNPTLGGVVQGPFVAMSFNRSILGTKGGARTNQTGQVLRADASVIPGLFCAGNAMANPIGTRAVGAGTTIGPCLTWGYICGNAIAQVARPEPELLRVDGGETGQTTALE